MNVLKGRCHVPWRLGLEVSILHRKKIGEKRAKEYCRPKKERCKNLRKLSGRRTLESVRKLQWIKHAFMRKVMHVSLTFSSILD